LESLAARKSPEAGSLIEEYAQDLTYMEQATIEVAKIINALPDDATRRVFAARYLHKMTWEEVADDTFLSVTHVQRLHKKGIAWLEKYYKS